MQIRSIDQTNPTLELSYEMQRTQQTNRVKSHTVTCYRNFLIAPVNATYAYWVIIQFTIQDELLIELSSCQKSWNGPLRARSAGTCTTGMKCRGFDLRTHADNDFGVNYYNFRVIAHYSDWIFSDCAQSFAISYNCYRYILQSRFRHGRCILITMKRKSFCT